MGKRKVVRVGGFKYESGDLLVNRIKTELDAKHIRYEKVIPTGGYCERPRIVFFSSDQMWNMLKAMKSIKFQGGNLRAAGRQHLWHGIDKLGWEIGVSKQQVKSIQILEPVAKAIFPQNQTHDFTTAFDIRNDRGEVIFLPNKLPGNTHMGGPIKLFDCDRMSHKLQVTSTAPALLTDLGLNIPLTDHIASIQAAGDP